MGKRKQFCPQGHDTFIVGRSGSTCRECCKQYDRKRHRERTSWKHKNPERERMFNRIGHLRRDIKRRRQVKLQQIAALVEEFNNG